MTPNPDFNGTPSFNVKYLGNDTRWAQLLWIINRNSYAIYGVK